MAVIAVLFVIFSPSPSFAFVPSNITDCYVKDLHSNITVQKDSSLLIEEEITVDCGDLPDKHGITRTVAEQIAVKGEKINTPVKLVSIREADGSPVPYLAKSDNFKHTVSWEIGDQKKTFTGEKEYTIIYSVRNAIRSGGSEGDEFYWNLSGDLWDIAIDDFSADISFPPEADRNSGKVYLYGSSDPGSGDRIKYNWTGDNTLNFLYEGDILPGRGVAASVAFPKNIFKIYEPSFIEKYWEVLWFLLPTSVFLLCYLLWEKYGRDPKVNKTVSPEFGAPEGLTPIEVGTLESIGDFKGPFISAAIVDLAVKKYMIIEEIDRKWYAGGKDFKLKKNRPEEDFLMLSLPEKTLTEKMFRERREIFLSLLNDRFYKDIPEIKRAVASDLALRNLMTQTGSTLKIAFVAAACVLFFAGFFLFMALGSTAVAISVILSVFTFIIFGFFMPKRTPKGAELHWRIKGLRMCVEDPGKYSQQILEKEGIFERLLPYAMLFGTEDVWIRKMEEIYGQDYFQRYSPSWYSGSSGGFNADAFIERMKVLSVGIAASTGTDPG